MNLTNLIKGLIFSQKIIIIIIIEFTSDSYQKMQIRLIIFRSKQTSRQQLVVRDGNTQVPLRDRLVMSVKNCNIYVFFDKMCVNCYYQNSHILILQQWTHIYHYELNIYNETQIFYQNQHESRNGPKCDPIRETLECRVFLYVCVHVRATRILS